MAKKNSIKDTEQTLSLFGKIRAIFKNETIHFVIGLILVIFSVYLLLAFSSFFFTGAADQSIIDSGSAQELASTNNGVKNYAGSRGAQLASYLINDCFVFLHSCVPCSGGTEVDACACGSALEVVYRMLAIARLVLCLLWIRFCGAVQRFFLISGRYAWIQC